MGCGRDLRRCLFGAVAIAALAAACGGGTDGGTHAIRSVTDGPPAEGKPRYGGEITYALDAETGGGFCLPSAQLALGGIYVATTIYDTLTVPDDKGEYVPYLAEAVEHNATYDEWTVTLREGIEFHNGEPFDAEAVKQNLDAYREGLLFQFLFADVADVRVLDPLTVKITTEVPWVAFPAFLYGSGRVGMAAPEQLEDPACDRNMIGTGPFELVDWVVNDRLVVERNDDYWQEGLPYLDRIVFRPTPERAQRVNGLRGGELDVVYVTEGTEINELRREAEAGEINVVVTEDLATLAYTMFNVSKPPFDSKIAREAFVRAVDREERNDIINDGTFTVTDQPFTPDDPAYVDPEELDYPDYDPDRARELVRRYERETGRELAFTLGATPEQNVVRDAQVVQDQLEAVGMDVEISTAEQAQYINDTLAGNFEANLWANFHGDDPDTSWVWWHGGSLVNFGRFRDPEIDAALDQGRSELDPQRRDEIYSALAPEFARELYNDWSWYGRQAWGMRKNVRGLYGVPLPGGGRRGIRVNVAPTVGLWLDE